MTELAETREIDQTWKVGVYKNALHEIQRRIQNRPSPAILFEIDEIIKKVMESEARHDLPGHAETMDGLNSLTIRK